MAKVYHSTVSSSLGAATGQTNDGSLLRLDTTFSSLVCGNEKPSRQEEEITGVSVRFREHGEDSFMVQPGARTEKMYRVWALHQPNELHILPAIVDTEEECLKYERLTIRILNLPMQNGIKQMLNERTRMFRMWPRLRARLTTQQDITLNC